MRVSKTCKVLFVDDDPMVRDCFEMLCFVILSQQFDVVAVTVGNVDEAERKIEGGPPFDLIVCDFQMPRRNGSELLKSLVATGYRTPFILFTGHSEPDIELYELSAKYVGDIYFCLNKDWARLQDLLREQLSRLREK